ncbi:MAG: hypothetical protein JST54_36010, partial [Deltaproteobacteria bacterium]|nr:hypothetical protein [Deltaproteobacteria bacterium]
MAASRMMFNGVDVEQILSDAEVGVEANLDKSRTVKIGGPAMKKPDLLAEIAAQRKPFLDVLAARNELEAKIKARDAALPAVLDFVKKYDAGITAELGTDPNVKAKYGLPSKKAKRALTAEQTVRKVAKMRATRELRGTMGKREKERVEATGDFTVSVGQTSQAPSATATPAPAPVVQPAPVASNPAPTQPSPAPDPVLQSVPAPTGGDATAIA